MDEKPVLPLEYASPRKAEGLSPASKQRAAGRLIGAVRQLVFAIGLAIIARGIGEGGLDPRSSNLGPWMGWGGFLVGLAIPFRRGNRFW